MRYLVAPYKVENYQNISIEEAIRRVRKWPYVCLDIETRGNMDFIHSHVPTLLQLGCNGEVIVIDSPNKVDYLSKKKIIGHNLKFDLSVLKNAFSFEAKEIFDTMLAAQILECGLNSLPGHFTLESATRRYTSNIYAYTEQGNLFDEVVTKKIRKTFLTASSPFTKAQLDYASQDVENTERLYRVLNQRIKEESLQKTADVEFNFCKLLVEMELFGIKVDEDKWLKVASQVLIELDEVTTELSEINPINWNSSKQVLHYFKELGVRVEFFDRKTGEMKETVARPVVEKEENRFPIVAKYIKYKKLQKLYGTYGPGFLGHVSPFTGRIHTSIFQIMSTGRTSSSHPNLQNIVRGSSYREAFIPAEDSVFIVADYSSQEIHVAADVTKEPKLIEFLKQGKDPHLETAKLVFDNPNLTKDSEERQMAKSIGFLMLYGGGPTKLSNNIGIPLAKAKSIIELYFKTYTNFKDAFEKGGIEAEQNGYILHDKKYKRKSYVYFYNTLLFAKAHIDKFKACGWEPHSRIEDTYKKYRAELQRHSQNYKIQGLSATMSKIAGLLIHERIKGKGNLVLLIHDEWLVEAKKEYQEEVKKIVEDSMKEASSMVLSALTIKADAKIVPCWKK